MECIQVICAGADSWDQTIRECEIMLRKLHLGLMPLLEYKWVRDSQGEGGHIYMLMPFYRSGSLWDLVHARLSKTEPFSASEMLSILSQVQLMPLS
jgi:serine/threonine protein kinase